MYFHLVFHFTLLNTLYSKADGVGFIAHHDHIMAIVVLYNSISDRRFAEFYFAMI